MKTNEINCRNHITFHTHQHFSFIIQTIKIIDVETECKHKNMIFISQNQFSVPFNLNIYQKIHKQTKM